MARVVQQRSGPPYLLILMVFLFLIASTLAVLGYMKSDKLQEQMTRKTELQNKVARADDLENPTIRQLVSRYDSPPPKEKPKTVVKQLLGQIRALSKYLTGQETDAEAAMAEALTVQEAIGSRRGLAVDATEMSNQLELVHELVQQKDLLLAEMQKQLADKDSEMRAAAADLQTRMDDLQNRVAQLDQSAGTSHKTYQDDLARTRDEWAKRRDVFNENIAGKTQIIQTLQRTNVDLGEQIAKLRKRLDKAQPLVDPMTPAFKPDGKILRVVAGDKLCYINLGAKDNVTAGLTFTVYPSTGIPKDGKGKASLVLTEVSETVSECRIQDQLRTDPVMAGDLVANLAFDAARTYTFVVLGDFDLHGTGVATPENAEEAKMLLRRFGGKIANEVDIYTDFVILGQKPDRPVEPSPLDPPQMRQVYREKLKVIERFERIETLATSLHIPMLNTNRFLAFIGYTPTMAGG